MGLPCKRWMLGSVGVPFYVDETAKCLKFIDELLQAPTVFGRLVLVASTWEASFQRYRHPIVQRAFSERTMNHAFLALHWKIFHEWMRLSDSDRKRDSFSSWPKRTLRLQQWWMHGSIPKGIERSCLRTLQSTIARHLSES
jgi:hypothetical protein